MGLYRDAESNLASAIAASRNGCRLLAIPELRDDVAFCARRDVETVVVAMSPNGRLVRR
jgi:phosphosulfolactate phosphohydrolase-like enzyme